MSRALLAVLAGAIVFAAVGALGTVLVFEWRPLARHGIPLAVPVLAVVVVAFLLADIAFERVKSPPS